MLTQTISQIQERGLTDMAESGHLTCVCVCVCSFNSMIAVGSSVAIEPHRINMSLWRGCGAPGMLTCGGAALTTIDKRVRWLLAIQIPDWES